MLLRGGLVRTAGWFLMPFPESHPLLFYIHFKRPAVYQVSYRSHFAMWFTSRLRPSERSRGSLCGHLEQHRCSLGLTAGCQMYDRRTVWHLKAASDDLANQLRSLLWVGE
jgi:hypothetical protein